MKRGLPLLLLLVSACGRSGNGLPPDALFVNGKIALLDDGLRFF